MVVRIYFLNTQCLDIFTEVFMSGTEELSVCEGLS